MSPPVQVVAHRVLGQSADYPAFSTVTLPLDAGDASSVLVRFRVASDSGVGSPGWELDDLSFDGVSQPLFDAVVAQPAKCNNLPFAQVGPDQFVEDVDVVSSPTQVILDGSGSFDADGDVSSYRWEQLSGPAVTLTGADTVQPSFAAPDVASGAAPVELTFQLLVSDGTALSTPAIVRVVVFDAAVAPEADAGAAPEAGPASDTAASETAASDTAR